METKFPGMITKEQEGGMPDVGVLPNSSRMTNDEMVGIKDQGYLTKKGTPSGLKAEFNFLPPGMDIEDQENSDQRSLKQMDYKGGLSYPGDGWT